MTHNIRHISFGKSLPEKSNPLDNHSEVATEGKIPAQFFCHGKFWIGVSFSLGFT